MTWATSVALSAAGYQIVVVSECCSAPRQLIGWVGTNARSVTPTLNGARTSCANAEASGKASESKARNLFAVIFFSCKCVRAGMRRDVHILVRSGRGQKRNATKARIGGVKCSRQE